MQGGLAERFGIGIPLCPLYFYFNLKGMGKQINLAKNPRPGNPITGLGASPKAQPFLGFAGLVEGKGINWPGTMLGQFADRPFGGFPAGAPLPALRRGKSLDS